ncbi:MAG: multidrug efflux RND transporter permease subunit [Phycisphaerae bacterium]|nr:multidrug efflux RND transporter permease subunit [Phycisphaerae bacterium]
MLSAFFINRPIFATVVSIVITLFGVISIPLLPVEQTPDITPPTISVRANYPGADAQTVAETVAAPIEDQVNGVEKMLYMSSTSGNDGSMGLTVTFEVGTDVDMAAVMVQNRVSAAISQLPEEVQRQGVVTRKRSTTIVLFANLISPDGRFDETYLSNYAKTQVVDALGRVDGVGDVMVFGARDYSMRIWLDPSLLRARGLSVEDVLNAIREQNVQVAAGQIGMPPAPAGLKTVYIVRTRGRLKTAEEFENIVIKTGAEGQMLRVGDVARVELGAESYSVYGQKDGKPSVAIGVFMTPGANALSVSEGVREEFARLKETFPEGLDYTITYDTTKYISASINEVLETLIIAGILVILTIYIFLQDIRTTIIPSLAIPVSLIGTFAVMLAMGMTINTFTLFGLVLAIGIVVDDAIVVVENVVRIMEEEGLDGKTASFKAMGQITGALIATSLVLMAVFIPSTMVSGITGRMYRQFALTISVATAFSTINALTLSPALCALFLKPGTKKHHLGFRLFNKFFNWTTRGYMNLLGMTVRRTVFAMSIFVILSMLTLVGFKSLPTGFLPNEDQGFMMVNVELPEGAPLERTKNVMDRINGILENTEGVETYITLGGHSILNNISSTNSGFAIISLKDWSERKTPELSASGIQMKLMMQLAQINEAISFAFIPPPVPGLGLAGGFELQLQNRGTTDVGELENIANDLVMRGSQSPVLTRMNSSFRANIPQLMLHIDREKAKSLNVHLSSIFQTLAGTLGEYYVNDFNLFGKTYRVRVQADADYRDKIEKINTIEVRSQTGKMIPLNTLLTVEETTGPIAINRFNMYTSATISGQAAPGYSSGQAMETMEEIARQALPPSMGYEWSGISFQERQAGTKTTMIFTMGIIFVILVLAAQYESWATPMAVILAVPVALMGAVAATYIRHFDNNIYMQIGLVLLIGQASKTAILIVEFAKQAHDQGKGIIEAVLEGSRIRFRPILMTAFTFILGVFPLVIATGAGAAGRQAMGTAVFGGMLSATILGVFLVPVFFVVVQYIADGLKRLVHKTPPYSQSSSQSGPIES